MGAGGDNALPALRPELRLLDGAPAAHGEPMWLIHDPLQNRFIQIDLAAYETLSLWGSSRTANELVRRVNERGRVSLDEASLAALIGFLSRHKLTSETEREGWRTLAAERARARRSLWSWLIHNYLFFRLPLWRPQAFLERTLPVVRGLGSRTAGIAIALIGLAGLYLVSREWESYIATFQGFLTWEGAVLMALALAAVKAVHELAHAYTAVHYGCRVPTMGVAVMLMAPLLYTDVTDAWRLEDRRHRLAIDSAGIRAELAIAAVALFAWAFLPDGPARSLSFLLSAVSLLSGLVINLNPFMRFDGYYLLSETMGIENLQPRAFALGVWKLREWLFALGRAAPEALPRGRLAIMIVYAYLTWIYRIALFLGIALVVYQYFFKALGVMLFAVEIAYFIVRPIAKEVAAWIEIRREIAARRRVLAPLVTLAAVLLLVIVPWSSRVEIPAVIEAAELQHVHAPRPARIVAVHVARGAEVAAGDRLVTLASPDIEHELALTETRLKLARMKHARRGADAIDREASIVIENEIAAQLARIAGLTKERAELTLRAPFAGRIVELDPALHAGRWVSPKSLLAVVAGGSGTVARGYVAEADVGRIVRGDVGHFVPDHPERPGVPVAVGEVALSSAANLEIEDLASTFGGRIAITPDGADRLAPASAHYLVRMPAGEGAGGTELAARGVVVVSGQRESLLARAWRQTLKVLLRESGA
ncbi:MAG: HlyD family efflux transporter periplasmic adaptor subunit [Pseudomonadota bacterium]